MEVLKIMANKSVVIYELDTIQTIVKSLESLHIGNVEDAKKIISVHEILNKGFISITELAQTGEESENTSKDDDACETVENTSEDHTKNDPLSGEDSFNVISKDEDSE